MNTPETNNTSANETNVWSENPWNLPYDLEYVNKVRTTMPLTAKTERIDHALMPKHLENPEQIFHTLPPTEGEFYDGSEKKGRLKRLSWKLGRVATSAVNMVTEVPDFAFNSVMAGAAKAGEKFWEGTSRVAASLGSTALELDSPDAHIMIPVQNFADKMARTKSDNHENFSMKAGLGRPSYETSFDDDLDYYARQAEKYRKQAAYHYSHGDLAKAEQLTKQARKARARHISR